MLLSDRGLHWVGVGILRIQELLISKFSALLRSSAPERGSLVQFHLPILTAKFLLSRKTMNRYKGADFPHNIFVRLSGRIFC